jgi:hypothetical protein
MRIFFFFFGGSKAKYKYFWGNLLWWLRPFRDLRSVPEAGNVIRKQSQGEKSWYFWHPKIYPVRDSQRDPRVGWIFWWILPCWWGPGPAGPGAPAFVRARNARAARAPSTPRLPCSSSSHTRPSKLPLYCSHLCFCEKKSSWSLLLATCFSALLSYLFDSLYFLSLSVLSIFRIVELFFFFFFASAYYPLVAVSWGLWQGFWGWSNLCVLSRRLRFFERNSSF